MGDLFENLRIYLRHTSREQVLKDWDSTKLFDNINGPLIEDFVSSMNCFYMKGYEYLDTHLNNNLFNTIENPSFSSDFF